MAEAHGIAIIRECVDIRQPLEKKEKKNPQFSEMVKLLLGCHLSLAVRINTHNRVISCGRMGDRYFNVSTTF